MVGAVVLVATVSITKVRGVWCLGNVVYVSAVSRVDVVRVVVSGVVVLG